MAEQWERLYRERFDQLVREADALVRDRAQAEDLAQDAFTRLLSAGLRDPRQAWAWLRVVVRRLAIDHFRRVQEVPRAAPDSPFHVESAEVSALEHIDQERVRTVLSTIPARDRDVLWLRHEGLSYREIARATGVPEAQVGVALIRAMKKLERAWTAVTNREDHDG